MQKNLRISVPFLVYFFNLFLQLTSASRDSVQMESTLSCTLDVNSSIGTVQASFLNLSQVLTSSCFDPAVLVTHRITVVKILVRHTITIDTDWNQTVLGHEKSTNSEKFKSISLLIIAPRWIIHGDRTFDLSGSRGESYQDKPPAGQNSYGDGLRGKDGEAGEDAGDFFGIGNQFMGSSTNWSLKIRADGGQGGWGQDGGYGADGHDGVSIHLDKIHVSADSVFNIQSLYTAEAVSWNRFIYKLSPATSGIRGRDGGDGGNGGQGGSPGKILILRLEESGEGDSEGSENPELSGHVSKSQFPGRQGKGGRGGRGGFGQPTRKFVFLHTFSIPSLAEIDQGKPEILTTRDFCEFMKNKNTVHMSDCIRDYGTAGDPDRVSRPGQNGAVLRPSQHRPPTLIDDYQKNVAEYLSWSREDTLQMLHQKIGVRSPKGQTEGEKQREFVTILETQSKFYRTLTESPRIRDFYNVHGFIQEFKDLEVSYFFNKDDPGIFSLTEMDPNGWWSYPNFYGAFLQSLYRFSEGIEEEEEEEIKSVIRLLVMATYSRIIGVNYRILGESTLITDINSFLTLTKSSLREFLETQEKQKGLAAIQKVEMDYKMEIDQKFVKAAALIFNVVNVEIRKTEESFKAHIEILQREIDDLVKSEENSIAKLEKARALMRERQAQDLFFGILKLGSQCLSIFGPKGQAVGAAVSAATTIAQSVTTLSSSDLVVNLPQNFPLPPALQAAQAGWVEELSLDTYQQAFAFYKDMDNSLDILTAGLNYNTTEEALGDAVFEVEKKVLETRDTLQDIMELELELQQEQSRLTPIFSRRRRDLGQSCTDSGIIDYSMGKMRNRLTTDKFIQESKEDIQETVRKEAAALDTTQDGKTRDNKFIKGMLKFQQVTQILGGVAAVVQQFKSSDKSVDEIDAQIQQRERKIERLEEHKIKVENKLRPLLVDGLQGRFGVDSDFRTKLETTSSIGLTVQSMKVQGLLRDIKVVIKNEFTEGFQVQEFLARAVEKLEEGLVTLINVYDKLQGYEEQSKMASFISSVASSSLLFSSFPSSSASRFHFRDQKLRETAQQLQLTIQSTVILTRFEKVLSAFKMWVFPFAHLYLGKFALPPQSTILNRTDPEVKLQRLVESVIEKVDGMIEDKQKYDSSVLGYDAFIQQSEFYKSPGREPFFAWRNEDGDGEMIRQLLAGHVVRAKAHIAGGWEQMNMKIDAVKFTEIGIHLYSEDETVAAELERILQLYQVSLRHLGDSRYRFNGTTYLMRTEPLKPWRLSFERNRAKETSIPTQGLPVTRNKVFEKVAKGDVMLSPYATWEMLITPIRYSTSAFPQGAKGGEAETDLNVGVDNSMKKLLEFAPHVEVHLIGRGSYISDHGLTTPFPQLDLHVDNYYVKDDSIVFKRRRRNVEGETTVSKITMVTLTSATLAVASLSLFSLYVWRRVWKMGEWW